jgi:hypothetical protein
VLLELDEGVAGERAREVAVAHQRRGQAQRRLVAELVWAGRVEHGLPERLLADAERVDVVLQAEAGAARRIGRAARRTRDPRA